MTRLRSCVEVDVLDQSQPMHLEGIILRDHHPGAHLGEAGVCVHEEMLSIVDKDVAKVIETDLQHSFV